ASRSGRSTSTASASTPLSSGRAATRGSPSSSTSGSPTWSPPARERRNAMRDSAAAHGTGSSYAALRTRAIESLLLEKGLVSSDVEIGVWDSSAETRYMVLPLRPAGTEGLDEEELVPLVTREAMIGTGLPRTQ